MSFADRLRMSLEQARQIAESPSNKITHVLVNNDATYSVMSHIVCEYCDYCDSQGDCREAGKMPALAKEDPYEISGRE